jgi:cytochrome b involved in lipid metabolism
VKKPDYLNVNRKATEVSRPNHPGGDDISQTADGKDLPEPGS